MILNKQKFEDIKEQIPKDLYEILVNKKKRVQEEEKGVRENMTKKLQVVESEEYLKCLLQSLEPYPRNKTMEILIMGGEYEEIRGEES